MNKVVIQKGFCPTQQRDYQVQIDYIDTSSLSGRSYTKGIGDCGYIRSGGICDVNCPIIAAAPNKI